MLFATNLQGYFARFEFKICCGNLRGVDYYYKNLDLAAGVVLILTLFILIKSILGDFDDGFSLFVERIFQIF